MRDLLIIGSGPAGLSASLYAKRANLDVLVVEKEYLGTGQIAESAQVDNYIGLAGKSGYDIGEAFRQDAEKFGAEFYEASVTDIKPQNGHWITRLENGESISSKAIIYAAGAVHRRLHVPGEEKFTGNGVSFCALCDGSFYQGKTVAVVGGGDTALDDALYLSDIAGKVYLIHRRDAFRGAEKSVRRVKARANIEVILSANVTGITGESQVEAVMLDNGRRLSVDGVFVAVGMIPQSGMLKHLVRLDPNGYAVADETGETDAPGLFVAGDVRTKRLRQVVTAVADGANAAISASEYLKSINDLSQTTDSEV
ncbi:MAG: FAD-dependent oxidoreductase [Clostridia bacterium]|nr:FAD-dependent oxidoreductase [Clostridia bacterium]